MRWILLSAVIATALWVSAGTASAVARPKPVDAGFTANVTRVWDQNSCCVIARELQGTARISGIGRLHFRGEYDMVVHFVRPNPVETGYLYLTFAAANGDRFTISGTSDSFARGELPPAAPWTILDATGRFASYSGSGTYTIAGLDPASPLDATPLGVSLSGTVTG